MPEGLQMLVLATGVNGVVQFITVFVIFAIVLVLTYFSTRLVGGVQKNKYAGGNIEVVEAVSIGNNKYVQILRVGNKYFAVTVCKDTVTLLGEIDKESLNEKTLLKSGNDGFDAIFGKFLNGAKKQDESNQEDK